MAKPLSEDLRVRVVQAVEGGMSRRAAAERSASRSPARCELTKTINSRETINFAADANRITQAG